ncbi:hypothetical protein Nepgr_030270 [Nepenthes gracilis]|uniref:Uncharacterized protein n=1 Tax=Nepenthes gracilis TaxID=150966 RepID=A0AAD3TGQ1_NEPGR|nr:hypothetical protein Nepgr_030270 [Nepenthes gracilis]
MHLTTRAIKVSTPKSWDERSLQVDSLNSPDRRGARLGSPSVLMNSPDLRNRGHNRKLSMGAELGRSDASGGFMRKWGLDELDRQ